jgi:hypothetical protein
MRQGDVLLVPTKRSTKGFTEVKRDKKRVILAYGEVTGHAHAILEKDAVLFDNGNGIRILSVESEAQLVHEEHSTIVLPKGNYEIRIQREYSPEAIRNVAD